MQKLCNKDEIIILVSYVQNKIFMVIGKVMKLEITYTNEKVITFVLQSQISNYYFNSVLQINNLGFIHF